MGHSIDMCFNVFFPGSYSSQSPECGSEGRDATEESEGDDDEEEGEEGWHVVAGAATLPR